MLSDACFDFGSDLEKGVPMKQAAEEFLKRVEWYGRPDYPLEYPPEQIDALRTAIRAVLANPDDAQKLRTLAEAVRAHYDSDGQVPLDLEQLTA
jgi:hypothetical protein